MKIVQNELREKAKELLAKKEVDLIIGFGAGTLPLRTTPLFVRTPDEAEQLVWNSFCENNLATYLHKFSRFKLGIVVKGCDSRSVTALSLEKRFTPDQVLLIGIPCGRMVDRKKIKRVVKGEILQAREEGDQIVVAGENFQLSLERDDFLYPVCRTCTHRNPARANILLGDGSVEESALTEAYAEVKEFEGKGPAERWAFFENETRRCIRCYACREACPMCYCSECFVDCSNPRWIEKGTSPSDLQFYHIVRAYHQAGRCTACGACERACPMDIRLTYLTQKLNQDADELFQFEPGTDPDASPPLSTYNPDDRQEFIK